MMVGDDMIDKFIDIYFPNIYLYQKILLKQILKKKPLTQCNPTHTTINMSGLRSNSIIYDELIMEIGKKGTTNGKED